MATFSDFNIDSGEGLRKFIESCGLVVEHVYRIDTNNNCIYLPNISSLNWKSSYDKVRYNCQEDTKKLVEKATELKSFDNSKSDKTHPYSFWIENMADLVDVIAILKKIEVNIKKENAL